MGKVAIISDPNGLGIQAASEDGNSLLVIHGYATPNVTLGTVYELRRLSDAEDLGITADADITANKLVHYHIEEYFRLAPGTKLWILPLATSVAMDDFSTPTANALRDLLGQVRQVGWVSNYTDVLFNALAIVNGMPEVVHDAITSASLLWTSERDKNRPLHAIFVDGFKMSASASALADMRAKEAIGVGVVIAQDLDVVFGTSLCVKHHSAVGTVLGIKAGKSVETNIGETERNDLQDVRLGKWVKPGLSNNLSVTTLNDDPTASDFDLLTEKGYIHVRGYQGYPGVFFDDDPSCEVATSDFYSISNTAVYAKAHREVYKRLVGEVNKKILIDVETGQITASDCARFENLGNEVIGATGFMTRAGEISGGQTLCNPAQDVLTTSKVAVGFAIVPVGYARKIEGTISFTKKLSN